MNNNAANNNAAIAKYIVNATKSSKRMIESRAYARSLSKRFHCSIFKIYGLFSFLSCKTHQIRFVIRVKGGKSFIH